MKPDFSRRSTQAELMDDGCESFAEFGACLRELETINHLIFAYRPTLGWLRDVTRSSKNSFSILDVGSGGGDMLRMIRRKVRGADWQLTGVDINPWSAQSAQQASDADGIRYETKNIFSYAADETFDFIISSLFTHHLSNDELVRFIQWMDVHASRGWIINDLHRHWLPYYFIKAATWLFSRNRLIRHDAAVSVARAFTRRDWLAIIASSGIAADRVAIQWRFPFRYVVSCRKI